MFFPQPYCTFVFIKYDRFLTPFYILYINAKIFEYLHHRYLLLLLSICHTIPYPYPLSFSNFFPILLIIWNAIHVSVFWFWFSMLKICFHVFHLIWWLFWPWATLKVQEVTYFCCIFCRFNFVIMLVYLMLWDQTLTQANFALISSRVWSQFLSLPHPFQ